MFSCSSSSFRAEYFSFAGEPNEPEGEPKGVEVAGGESIREDVDGGEPKGDVEGVGGEKVGIKTPLDIVGDDLDGGLNIVLSAAASPLCL